MKLNDKVKLILPTLFVFILMITLIAGATYAYLTVQSNNKTTTSKYSATIPEMGIVVLNQGKNLALNLNRPNMMQAGTNITYYATESGVPATSQTSEPIVATASVEGYGTFECDYTIHIAMTGDLYSTFRTLPNRQNGMIVLRVNSTDYDFNGDTNFAGFDVSGTLKNLSEKTPNHITSSFRLVNSSTVDQTILNNKSVNFNYTLTYFNCKATY